MSAYTYFLDHLLWGGDPDEPHPITNMSKRDVYNVQRSWSKFYKDAIKNGMNVFVKIFEIAPPAQSFFVNIRNMTEEQYRSSHQFRAHVLNFMTSFNMAVTNLHQPEVVIPLMQKLGVAHKKVNVLPEHFDVATQALEFFLRKDFHASDAVIESWMKFLNFLYTPILKKLNE